MNRKGLGLLAIVSVMVSAIYLNKPNENEFINWFQKKYNVQCEDVDCSLITLENNSDTLKDKKFWHAEGYIDDTSGFLAMGMQVKRLYRNVNETNEYFSITASGFLGNFKELDFQQNGVEIK